MFRQLRTVLPRIHSTQMLRFEPVAVNSVSLCSSVGSSGSSQPQDNQTFAALMRNCKLTSVGDPVGKIVVGKIYHIVENDLYIDFGHKFGCVCKKPR